MPKSHVFQDIGFILTAIGAEQGEEKRTGADGPEEEPALALDRSDKYHIRRQIEEGGGMIIDDLLSFYRGRQRIRHQPSLIFILASRSSRTKKFMLGLALGESF